MYLVPAGVLASLPQELAHGHEEACDDAAYEDDEDTAHVVHGEFGGGALGAFLYMALLGPQLSLPPFGLPLVDLLGFFQA